MRQIDTKEWKEFIIKDIFTVKRPIARSQANYDEGNIPFVASGNFNNGVLKYLNPKKDEILDAGNCITVSPIDGSCFYQENDFLGRGGAGSSIILLYNPKLNLYNGYFIATVIRTVCRKYAYSDMANKNTIGAEKIKLPVDKTGNPDFLYMELYMKNLELAVSSSLTDLQSAKKSSVSKKLDTSNWKLFKIEDLFEKLELKTIKKDFNKAFDVSEIQDNEFSLPLVNAKHFNNGIMYYGREKDFENAEMTIDIVKNGAIATGDVYAQPQKTGVLWDAYLIKPKEKIQSELVLFFLATSLEKAIKDKFSYDDKCIWQKVKKLFIPLPATCQSSPDYGYMEKYMKYILGNTEKSLNNLTMCV